VPDSLEVVEVAVVVAQQALAEVQAASPAAWREAGRTMRAAEATRSLKEDFMALGRVDFVNS
jgi:hypothetical protein